MIWYDQCWCKDRIIPCLMSNPSSYIEKWKGWPTSYALAVKMDYKWVLIIPIVGLTRTKRLEGLYGVYYLSWRLNQVLELWWQMVHILHVIWTLNWYSSVQTFRSCAYIHQNRIHKFLTLYGTAILKLSMNRDPFFLAFFILIDITITWCILKLLYTLKNNLQKKSLKS